MPPVAPELLVWSESLKIRSYDVDFTGRATSASLFRYFLEAAWNHAEALGVGYRHLASQGKFWVLSRLRIEAQRYPAWGSVGTLRTWPRTGTALFAMRDFEIVDETGTVMVAGASAWVVLDDASKRPQRMTGLLPGREGLSTRAALARDPEKLPGGETWDRHSSATVRYTDIDVNGHVGSSRYVGWILDDYPLEFHRAHSVRVLEVNYLGETLVGESLNIRTRQAGPTEFRHSLAIDNGDEVCRARLEWMPASADGG
jgi:medium-chain acyl-[acyl-carrier-protein] hydrolase